MPSLGADMEAGTLVEWLKHPGDRVKRGDIVAVVDTQKGAIEIEVFEDGVVDRTVVEPGQKVPVGTVLAVIRPDGAAGASLVHDDERARISPLARKVASELGVDLASVTGTGPHGAVTREDVERAAGRRRGVASAPPPSADRATAMRDAIAAAMTRSKREIPHYYLSTTIDMHAALAWLTAENAARPVGDRILPAALLIKATATALVAVPELNGYWIDGAFRTGTGIHVGVAIALRNGGLVAPALHDANRLTIPDLMRQLQDLVTRARSGSLKSSDVSDATITVTNLGDQGVDATFGIIYPPQVALVGFGRIAARPAVVDGKVDARPLVTATLSGDHRASDGHRGGLLLTAIARHLQQPETL